MLVSVFAFTNALVFVRVCVCVCVCVHVFVCVPACTCVHACLMEGGRVSPLSRWEEVDYHAERVVWRCHRSGQGVPGELVEVGPGGGLVIGTASF